MSKEQENSKQFWVTVDSDIWSVAAQRGYWDKQYGAENWRLVWQLPSKELLEFEQLFSLFVDSYAKFFEENLVDALFLTNHFSYVYDATYIYKESAFNPRALYHKNEFHHVAINWALTKVLGLEFKGLEPVGRDGARFWVPNRIPPHPDLIPSHPLYPNLYEFYKKASELQIKND